MSMCNDRASVLKRVQQQQQKHNTTETITCINQYRRSNIKHQQPTVNSQRVCLDSVLEVSLQTSHMKVHRHISL